MADTDAVKEALDNLCSEAHYNGNTLTLVKSWRDTIEEALASLAAEVDDWISVEDRMPEDAQKTYLVDSSWGVRAAYKHDPEWAQGCFQDVETSSDEGMYDYDKCKGAFVVYHWKPMPTAPSHTTNKEK